MDQSSRILTRQLGMEVVRNKPSRVEAYIKEKVLESARVSQVSST
jgi:hypothetical protein